MTRDLVFAVSRSDKGDLSRENALEEHQSQKGDLSRGNASEEYQQFGARGGKFSTARPKSDVDWAIYRYAACSCILSTCFDHLCICL